MTTFKTRQTSQVGHKSFLEKKKLDHLKTCQILNKRHLNEHVTFLVKFVKNHVNAFVLNFAEIAEIQQL